MHKCIPKYVDLKFLLIAFMHIHVHMETFIKTPGSNEETSGSEPEKDAEDEWVPVQQREEEVVRSPVRRGTNRKRGRARGRGRAGRGMTQRGMGSQRESVLLLPADREEG